MKILQIIPSLATGGAEVFVVSLCNALVRMGHDVTLLTFYQRSEDEFLYNRLDMKAKTDVLIKHKGFDPRQSIRLANYIRKHRFEVAHFHVQAIIYGLCPSLFYKRCRYIATIHNDAYKEAAGLHRKVRHFLFRNDLMIPVTISDESKRTFQELYGQNAPLIYNGIELPELKDCQNIVSKYKRTQDTKIFVLVASVNPVKNQLAAAKAFNELGQEGVDAVLILLGRLNESEYTEAVKKQASDYVVVFGQTSVPLQFLRFSDFFMLVSTYEGMPISLLEAMSMKLIPVVTPVGGCKDLVQDSVTGIVSRDCCVDSIKTAVKRALDLSEENRIKIKAKIGILGKQFSIEDCALKYLQIYRGL